MQFKNLVLLIERQIAERGLRRVVGNARSSNLRSIFAPVCRVVREALRRGCRTCSAREIDVHMVARNFFDFIYIEVFLGAVDETLLDRGHLLHGRVVSLLRLGLDINF